MSEPKLLSATEIKANELAEEFKKWIGDGHWRANDRTWGSFVVQVVIPRALRTAVVELENTKFQCTFLHGDNEGQIAHYRDQLITVRGERDQLKSHYSDAKELIQRMMKEEEVLRQERDRAKEALREMVRSAHPNRKEHPTMYKAWRNAEIVLGEFEDDIRALKPVSDQPQVENK